MAGGAAQGSDAQTCYCSFLRQLLESGTSPKRVKTILPNPKPETGSGPAPCSWLCPSRAAGPSLERTLSCVAAGTFVTAGACARDATKSNVNILVCVCVRARAAGLKVQPCHRHIFKIHNVTPRNGGRGAVII